MLAARSTRWTGSVVALLGLLTASLLLSLLPDSARAADGSATPAAVATTSPTPTPSPTGSSAGIDKLQVQVTASGRVDVLANDTCNSVIPCPVAEATNFKIVNAAGLLTSVRNPFDGYVTVTVPANNIAGVRRITYSYVVGSTLEQVTGYLDVNVVLPPTPDHYNPPAGARFAHAFTDHNWAIRRHVLRTMNSTPKGSMIRILTWSFNAKLYRDALLAAKARGVSVQVILAGRNTATNSDWGWLARHFGTDRTRRNWVMKCRMSCRGTGGTMHAKVFLFSQARNTRWITMSGSGNLTDFAVTNQWNQIFTVTNNYPVWAANVRIFEQAEKDTPARPRLAKLAFPGDIFWYTPLVPDKPATDFVMQTLNQTRCTGATINGGKTRLRFAIYTWIGLRGAWVANRVRELWNQGCDVRIVYAIMATGVKSILYNPGGRGRIPMRQMLLVDRTYKPIWYMHDKYITVSGNVGRNPKAYVVFQGSMNFSALSEASDENTQRLEGYPAFSAFPADFNLLWTSPQARAPAPTGGTIISEQRRLGTGRYMYMEPN